MGRFQSLILMSVALITLVSCSSTEDKIHLGSRDDIIVTNRGMPKPTSTPEALAPMMKQEAIEQKAQETVEKVKTTTKPTEEVIEKVALV